MAKSKMNMKRFQKLVEAYGAKPGLWPVAERPAAEKFLADNPGAAEIAGRAGALDAVLNELPAPKKADADFIKRLETIPFAAKAAAIGGEAAPATFQAFLRGLFPARTMLPQGVGIAVAGALGVWLGLSNALPHDYTGVEIDAGQYLLENPDLDKDLEQFR